MQNAEITVFIPVKNGADFIEDALKSVISQTFINWKLIIKDNCSSDNTKAIVRKYISDPRIILIEREADVGAGENFNSCLREVDTEFYLLLSHDDFLFHPQALEQAYKILKEHPEVCKVHSDMMFVDKLAQPISRRRFRRQGLVASDLVAKKSIVKVRNLYGIPLLLRSAYVQGHSYDLSLAYTSDIDFSIAVGKGRQIYHIPAPLIAIRFHPHNATHSRFDLIARELLVSARKYNIKLSLIDRVVMFFHDLYQRSAKTLFYFYLNHLRVFKKPDA